MTKRFTLIAIFLLSSLPAWAATQPVTLAVPDMTCAACPITVKIALNKIEGVSHVEVSYSNRQAVVSFDDTLTSVEALTQTTGDAGYPSTLKTPKTNQE